MVGLGGGRKQRQHAQGFAAANDTRERPGDGEGETERRDRETGEAEWKLRPNPYELTDNAYVQVFP
jgi:hypothetical protein